MRTYRVTLTGAPDALPDLELPVIEVSVYARLALTQIELMLPLSIDLLTAIEFRPNGGLLFESEDGSELYFSSSAHTLEYRYSGSDRRAILRAEGTYWSPVVANLGVVPVLQEFDSFSPATRYRIPVPLDGGLRPVIGDTVKCGDDVFAVGRVTWKLSTQYSYAEIDNGTAA